MTAPLFSVVIPAYNVEKYICETLQSVWSQTYQNFEVIVINDGSTDGTLYKISAEKDHRLRIITTENQGVSATRNLGINEAHGKYIAFLDGDDIWLPTHLEYAKKAFEKFPEIPWFSSNAKITEYIPHFLEEDNSNDAILINYFEGPCICVNSSTVIIQRNKLIPLSPFFPIGVVNAEDWIAWARFACLYPQIAYLDKENVIYRKRPFSATSIPLGDESTDKYLKLLEHLANLSHDPSLEKQFNKYYRYRTLERWLLIISNKNISNLSYYINKDVFCPDKITRRIVRYYIRLSNFLTRFFCKVLSVIDNYRTKYYTRYIEDINKKSNS
jgi:glycosyltransferase involved in cell wall biosynthesis